MMSDLDKETWASIERNNAQNARLESNFKQRCLALELIMSEETFIEHKKIAEQIAARLRERSKLYTEGPRGN